MGCIRERTPGGGVMFTCGSGIRSGQVPEYEVEDLLSEIVRLRSRLARVLALAQDARIGMRRGSPTGVWSWKRDQTRGKTWSTGQRARASGERG